MPIYTLPTETGSNYSAGPDQLAVYLSTQVPSFVPFALFSFFMIIFLGGVFATNRRTGANEYAQWFAVAGFGTFMLAGVAYLIPGLISLSTLVITLGIAIIGAFAFFSSNDRQ